MPDEQSINKQREYWQDKARQQLDLLFIASLEGDEKPHKSVLEDIGTSLLCLWKFDRKLEEMRKNAEREELHNS